jgi:uncharacterized SAM-binding protein YcdF (DUF218 family)
MHVLKAIAGAWLLPLPIALLLVCAGLALRSLAGRRRPGLMLITMGLALSVLASLPPVANALLRPLENRYPAVLDAAALQPAPRYVVVLGSGYHPRAGLPITAELDPTGVVRLTEGVRLFRQLPQTKLILSGGSVHGWPPVADGYALAAAALGVPQAAMILIDSPHDTGEEARALRSRVGSAPLLLVTSAAHMPRAMALARTMGLNAVAAPTDNLVLEPPPGQPWLPLPSGAALYKSEAAFHEYVGLLALEFGFP